MRGNLTLEELIRLAVDAKVSDIHVGLPGIVTAYANGRADVRLVVKRLVPTPDADDLAEDFPVLPSVPVLSIGGGTFRLTFPLLVGDEVLVLFMERDISEFLRTGETTAPPDQRLHHLAHAIAIPGSLRAAVAGAHPTITHDALTITIAPTALEVGGNVDSVPRDSLLQAELVAVAAAFASANAPAGGGPVTYVTPYTGPDPTASAVLKVGS